MSLKESTTELINKLKEDVVKQPIYVYCSHEFFDALIGKMHENGFKKRSAKPWYRKERW